MTELNDFEIHIMQGPDSETPVAEIFYKNTQWASIVDDEGLFKIQIYPPSDSDFWEFPLDESLKVLEKAKKNLKGQI